MKKEYPKLAEAFLHSMQRHTWYLTEELVLLCLGDDIKNGQKMAMHRKLMEFKISDTKVGKLKLPEMSESTELIDLIGPISWTLLKVAGLGVENVRQWINRKDMCWFEIFKSFAKNNCCVNDFAERSIRLIQDFVQAYNAEDMKQNVMLVARSNRKKASKEMKLVEMKNLV